MAPQHCDTPLPITITSASSPSVTVNITVTHNSQPPQGAFNPKIWYRLKNTGTPATHCLDVINDNSYDSLGLLKIARDGNYSGQHWQIRSNGDGTYFLRTLFLGPDRQLDVYAHDKSTPILQSTAHVTGQYWQIRPWDDGTWYLTNAYSGQYQYLDAMEGGGKVKMNAANAGRLTQRWSVTPIRRITEEGY